MSNDENSSIWFKETSISQALSDQAIGRWEVAPTTYQRGLSINVGLDVSKAPFWYMFLSHSQMCDNLDIEVLTY